MFNRNDRAGLAVLARKMFTRAILFSILVTALCSGCVEIEEKITIQSDGSGTVQMKVAFLQPTMRWLPGKPTVEWLRPNLPDGVRLNSFTNSQAPTTFKDTSGKVHEMVNEVYQVELSFDQIESLNDIRVRPDTRNAMAAGAGQAPGKENIASNAIPAADIGPFQKLTLVEDGDLIRFRRVVQAARDPRNSEMDMMSAPGSANRPQAYDLGDSKLKITIVCPGEVVEHNADRIEGQVLTWNFKLKQLQEDQDRDWIVAFVCKRGGQ